MIIIEKQKKQNVDENNKLQLFTLVKMFFFLLNKLSLHLEIHQKREKKLNTKMSQLNQGNLYTHSDFKRIE